MTSIPGKTIRLRTMQTTDLAYKVRWYNDPDINQTLYLNEPLELEKTVHWFEAASKDPTRRDFIIETHDAKPIGVMGLVEIDTTHQTAEIFLVIGDKNYWGKGVMFEAESLLIAWAFDTLSLQKIWAHAKPENLASLVTMKKLGFQIEGTLRQEKVLHGQRTDVIRVGLLRDEFKPGDFNQIS